MVPGEVSARVTADTFLTMSQRKLESTKMTTIARSRAEVSKNPPKKSGLGLPVDEFVRGFLKIDKFGIGRVSICHLESGRAKVKAHPCVTKMLQGVAGQQR
jgi:hypothetical protein